MASDDGGGPDSGHGSPVPPQPAMVDDSDDDLEPRFASRGIESFVRETSESDLLLPHEERLVSSSTDQRPPPPDRCSSVYMIMYLLGMGTLLPWNFFISVNSFWDYKFRDVNATSSSGDDVASPSPSPPQRTEMQKNFAAYLAIASNVPNAVFVILNAAYGQRFPFNRRVTYSSALIIVLFVVVSTLSLVDSDTWQKEFMILTLGLVVVVNCATAVFQGSIFGMAGPFPPKYMGAVMAGQAMGGIFPSVVGIVVVAAQIPPKDSGFSSFLIATVFLVASFIGFLWMTREPFYKFYAPADVASTRLPSQSTPTPAIAPPTLSIVQTILPYCTVVFLTFVQTISVFPAVTVLVESSQPEKNVWTERYFTLVTCFLLFNVGDYVGRIASSWLRWPRGNRTGRAILLAAAVLRFAFIPLFMYCNAAPDRRRTDVWITNDGAYVAIMAAFSLSNGFLSNSGMSLGPKTFETKEYQEAAAMVLVACLVLGVGVGSMLSYGFVSLL